jgi:eukaryotic-like serine/threonine-protein kinase
MYPQTYPTRHARYPVVFEVYPQDGTRLESENGAVEVHTEWSPGKVVGGKYRISRRLGEDEVATIYEAHTLSLNAPRLIRVLQPRLAADTIASEEFRKAADLLQRAPQTNVIAVEGRGNTEDGRPFLVTEFFQGQTLAEMQADEAIEPLRACSIVRQIASALKTAHRIGLLHLSLTPSNILVSGAPDGDSVKVQGFGAAYIRMRWARNESSPHNLTLRDHLPADPRYAAPELALGASPELLDERADLFSMGAVLYKMLTGRLPFAAPEAGRESSQSLESDSAVTTIVARLEDSPAPLGAGYGGMEVPAPLADLVMSLLGRRPKLRPASAHDVIERVALLETRIGSLATRRLTVTGEPASPARIAWQVSPSASAGSVEIDEGKLPPGLDVVAPSSPSHGALSTLDLQADPETVSARRLAAIPGADAAVAAPQPIADVRRARNAEFTPFSSEGPPKLPRFRRWALAAFVALVVAGGAWFFVTRGRTQWMGAGPLSPIKSDELRSVEGAAPPSSQAPQPTSQPVNQPETATTGAGQAEQPSEQPTTKAPAGGAAASQPASQVSTPNAPTGAQRGGTQPAAEPGKASFASKPSSTSAAASQSTPSPASPDDVAAQVKRAIAAGDVFFELGQYDYAIRAYQGPLKYDPKNQQLKLKIERAQKAKTAEEQYLGQ